MIIKTAISWAMPHYSPSDPPYVIQTLDQLVGGAVVLLVTGDTSKFKADCPASSEFEPGDWDGQIEVKAIYPDMIGSNGFERLQKALSTE